MARIRDAILIGFLLFLQSMQIQRFHLQYADWLFNVPQSFVYEEVKKKLSTCFLINEALWKVKNELAYLRNKVQFANFISWSLCEYTGSIT